MNRKIGMYSAIINFCAVTLFAVSMIFGFDFGGYLTSMFIALSFVPMVCAFVEKGGAKVAGKTAVAFAAIYATFILLIYFAQLTTLRNETLTDQATTILDYQAFGLFFNFNQLGYGMMSLSTFFVGLTITAKTKVDKALKCLLLIHGIFFISGLLLPTLGIFTVMDAEQGHFIGVLVLLIWCAYFAPIGILSFRHFNSQKGE
ncbi:MAG: hypothetical protein FWD97_07445 [Defluviitaleaceae bacterium]|nr:hypothetical protein [Defluviitaleaceae bacterium]